MNQIVIDFFEREKGRVRTETLPNGVRYLAGNTPRHRLHAQFAPLTEEQIDTLQRDVDVAQMTSFVFPAWYRDFLRTTNGCNLYFTCLSLDGEQTPLVRSEERQTYDKALLERNNPGWMAPFDLRFTNSVKYDRAAKERWLTIGSYPYDGTQVVWDAKAQQIVAMYPLPVSMSLRAKKTMKEADYEALICARWDDFDTFFLQETARLEAVVSKYGVDEEHGFLHREKTLPVGHKDYSI